MPSQCYSLSALRRSPHVTTWSTKLPSTPRRVARQWQLSRGIYSTRTPCITLGPAWPSVYATKRGYAKTATPGSNHMPALRMLNSAILIPGSINRAQPDKLVNHISPIAREDVARNAFCVLLVTPSFAPWLLDENTLVAKAVRRLYSRALRAGALPQDIVIGRAIDPPVGESGFEGIAYATLPDFASVPSTSPRSPDKGAIDFVLPGQTKERKPYTDTWRLPLANTIFQTGLPTTMYRTKWALDARKSTLILQEKTDVTHHGIRMAMSDTSHSQMSSVLSIPLMPLTFPRAVEGCMGNIIRRIINSQGESITASSELENVVPQFFRTRGEHAQPTTAWALVIPSKKLSLTQKRTSTCLNKHLGNWERGEGLQELLWQRVWGTRPGYWNTFVSRALAEGARLHRVLSGGGGWGKKAGLISLDPVPVSEEIPIRMEDATSGFDGPGDFSTALTPVVHEGDGIQFFISPSPPDQVKEDNALEALKSLPKQRTLGWEIGTVPSTVDAIPGGSWQHLGVDSNYIAVFKSNFGALSEGGLTLTRRRATSETQQMSVVATTTIDVPFSRLWSVELADQAGKESSTKNLKFSWQCESEELFHRLFKKDTALPVPIRKVAAISSLQIDMASDRYRLISTSITSLTEDHRSCMHSIHTRLRRYRKYSRTLRRLATEMSRKVEASRFSLNRLHREIEKITGEVWNSLSMATGKYSSKLVRFYTSQAKLPVRYFISKSGEQRSSEIEGSPASTTRSPRIGAGVRYPLHRGVQDRRRRGTIQDMMERATQQRVGKLRIRRHVVHTMLRIRRHPVQDSRLRIRRQRLGVGRRTTTSIEPRRRRKRSLSDPMRSQISRSRVRYIAPLIIERYRSIRPEQQKRLRRQQNPIELRRRTKEHLLQAVRSWLSGAPVTSKDVKAARRAGRPFGSRALGNQCGETNDADSNDAREENS